MDNKSEFLGTQNIRKLIFSLSLPAVTAQIVNMLYNVVDRMYIGHIKNTGAIALTGIGVCLPLIMLISAFAALISMGSAPRASIFMGKNEKEISEEILGNSFSLLLITGIFITVILFFIQKKLLFVFGASDNTIFYSMQYMKIYSLGTVFVQLALGMNAFISAQGFAKTSMLTILIGAIFNIILDPIFIFALNMGVSGAALATILSQAISAIWVINFLKSEKASLRLKRKNMKIHFKIILPCLALGLSPFIMQSTESIISMCFNTSLLKYGGDIAVGTMTILTSVMQFSLLPLHGFTQGAQPVISYNFGAQNKERVKKAFLTLLKVCLSYSFIIWSGTMIFPSAFISLFTSDITLKEYAIPMLRIYMLMSGIFGIQIACQQTFIAIGNAKTSLFLAVLRKIILLIPLIYILPCFMQNKTSAVYMAEPVADFFAVCTTALMFCHYFKKALKNMN